MNDLQSYISDYISYLGRLNFILTTKEFDIDDYNFEEIHRELSHREEECEKELISLHIKGENDAISRFENHLKNFILDNTHFPIDFDFRFEGLEEEIIVSKELLNSLHEKKIDSANSVCRFISNLQSLNTIEVTEPVEKIKWLGNVEQFGYIFGELVNGGYIQLPTKETEGSFSRLAELCLKYFEIHATKGRTAGQQTTKENLERAINPETNQLSLKGKETLKLPPLKDLK